MFVFRSLHADIVVPKSDTCHFGHINRLCYLLIQGGPKKPDHFLKCITFIYSDIGRHSIYQNVQLFIGSKNNILNAAVFKYSLHKVRETILH